MAFDNWKTKDGGWNNKVVAVVACCGLLLLVGLYYVFSNDLDSAITQHLNADNPPAATTGTGAGAPSSR
jgi:hypothetical protein